MHLKLEVIREATKPSEDVSIEWIVLECKHRIDYQYLNLTKEEARQHFADIEIKHLNANIERTTEEGNETQQCYVYITYRDDGTTPKSVLSNRSVYLLNDEGKTIERIN